MSAKQEVNRPYGVFLSEDGSNWKPTGDWYDRAVVAAAEAEGRNTTLKAWGVAARFRMLHGKDTERGKVWRDREANRLATGEYKPVPWADEKWFREWMTGFDYYAHLSNKTLGHVAYTPSEQYGDEDRQVILPPGKFMARFFRGIVKDEEIAKWCAALGATFEDRELRFAETVAELEEVYCKGPHSCLKGHRYWEVCGYSYLSSSPSTDSRLVKRADNYGNGYYYLLPDHPSREKIFTQGELAPEQLSVAYIKDTDDRVTARVLVWRDVKTYHMSNVYGDAIRLRHLLEEAGYKGGDAHSVLALRQARLSEKQREKTTS